MSKIKNQAKKNEDKVDREQLLEQIRTFIDNEIQPYIRMDGGEMRMVSLEEDGRLLVSMHGACHGCPSSVMTLQYGVQQAINERFPEYEIIVTPLEENSLTQDDQKEV